MNNSLIKKNGGMIMLVILVVVLILITKNPISNSLFGAVADYSIFNESGTDLSLCIRSIYTPITYLWLSIPAGSNVPLPSTFGPNSTYSGNVLILKYINPPPSTTTAPTVASHTPDNMYSVCFITGTKASINTNTKPESQPTIKLCAMSFLPIIQSSKLSNGIVSSFSAADMVPNGANGYNKCAVILPAFKVTDYSTSTDTGESIGTTYTYTAVVPGTNPPITQTRTVNNTNNYNCVYINDNINDGTNYRSRFILSVDNTYISPFKKTDPNSNSRSLGNVYSLQSSGSTAGDMNTIYYLVPYITSPVTVVSAGRNYLLKYSKANNIVFADLLTGTNMGTMDFFYGPNKGTNPGEFIPRNNDYPLVGNTFGDPGTISLTFGAGTVTSTTLTPYEIRYIDTIMDTIGSTTLNFYKLAISGTDYIKSGTASGGTPSTNAVAKIKTVTIKGISNIKPPFMPYVLEIPAGVSVNEITGSSTNPISYPSGTTKYIFRSINNSTNKDIKYVSTTGIPSTPVANLPSGRRSV